MTTSGGVFVPESDGAALLTGYVRLAFLAGSVFKYRTDDLNALRLCDHPEVMALAAHRTAMEAASEAFEGAAGGR